MGIHVTSLTQNVSQSCWKMIRRAAAVDIKAHYACTYLSFSSRQSHHIDPASPYAKLPGFGAGNNPGFVLEDIGTLFDLDGRSTCLEA